MPIGNGDPNKRLCYKWKLPLICFKRLLTINGLCQLRVSVLPSKCFDHIDQSQTNRLIFLDEQLLGNTHGHKLGTACTETSKNLKADPVCAVCRRSECSQEPCPDGEHNRAAKHGRVEEPGTIDDYASHNSSKSLTQEIWQEMNTACFCRRAF